MYIMKYSDHRHTYNHPANEGRWVALDLSSAGMPFATVQFSEAHVWNSLLDAISYQKHFPFLEIYELQVETRLVKAAYERKEA